MQGHFWPAGKAVATAGRERKWARRSACRRLSPGCRQKLHEADLELQRKREYIEELEPPVDGSSERDSVRGQTGGGASSRAGS